MEIKQRKSWSGQVTSKSIQDMFFSLQISGTQRLSLHRHHSLKDVMLEDCHWNKPYQKISDETDTQIKAHLKNNMYHRRVKRVSNEPDLGEENQYVLEHTESFLLKSRQKTAEKEDGGTSDGIAKPPEGGHCIGKDLSESNKAITMNVWATTSYDGNLLQSMQTDRFQEGTERNGNPVSNDTEEENEDGRGDGTETTLPDKHGDPTDLKENAFELLSDTEVKIIKGHINLTYTAQKKVFMTYICGGYQDSHPERNALFEKAYPDLYIYFKEKGFDFRMFDLRWGLKDGTINDHFMPSLHLKTLQKCQEAGQTAFFGFLGQKYDQIIIPDIVLKDVFETIKSTVEMMKQKAGTRKQSDSNTMPITGEGEPELSIKSDTESETHQGTPEQDNPNNNNADNGTEEMEIFIPTQRRPTLKYERDLGVLMQWYRLDENCNPSVYRLQSISTFYGDIFSRDPLRRQQAKIKWLGLLQKLYDVFQEYVPLALGSNAAASFFKTVLEQEIDQAFCVEGNPENHFHCFQRVITDIKYNLSSNRAPDYVDILTNKPEINKPLYEAQQNMIKGIYQRLRHTNVYENSVSWGRDGINPITNRSHAYYLDRLCRDFQRKVTAHFHRMTNVKPTPAKTWSRKRVFRNQRNEEILEHAKHCHTLVKCFMGQETFLRELEECTRSAAGHLIVLHGDQGSGKSSITAKVTSLAKQWIDGDLRIVTRFIGTTGESRSIRLLLQSLCYQIADIYNLSTHFSEDLKGLINEFSSLLELATEHMPLMIVLDGIDELSDHEAKLSWIPTVLPQHIYFIVSTSTESECASLKHLQKHSSHHIFVLIPPLSSVEIHAMTESWLTRDQRRLTSDQRKVLFNACAACPLPLFVLGSYMETYLWTSYASDKDTNLQSNISKMYSWILARLERNHGEQVVKKTTSFISFSRNGITLEELLDLLSLDQAVMNEVKQYQGVTVSVFPESLWLKLHNDFGIHLVEQRTDNTYVINFAHDVFRTTCVNRYAKSKDYPISIHSTFSDYYLESGSRHNKSDYAGPMMPLSWVGKPESKTGHVFNHRKILGISHHLIQSNQISRLVTQCIFNYEYLLHKAWATSLINIQDDLKDAINPERPVLDLILLSEVLHLSRDILLRDPCQLASQLMGRLHQIESSDKPVAPGDPRKYPFLPSLLSQCTQSSIPVFMPSFTCLLPPGGLLSETTAGHADCITAVAEAQDGLRVVTASIDCTLKVWDLSTGKAAYTLHGVGTNIDSITVCMQNKIVVTKNHSLQIWDLYQGKMLYGASDFLDAPILTSALDGQLLLAFFDGSHLVKVFDLADSCKLVCQVDIPVDETPVHKNHSILVSKNSVKDYILFAYRSGKEAMVLSAKRGAVVAKLTTQNPVASVQGVAVTKEYFLIICRYPSLKTHDIVHIELFSVHTFAYIRTVKGCGNDFITKFAVNRQGSHVIAFSQLPNTNATEILVWNLETEDHKHMAKFSSVPKGGLCSDLRCCVAFCEGENFLRTWNLANRINDQSLTVNMNRVMKIDGIQEVITMKNFPRYAVCRSVRPGLITIWNIVKSKCKGSAVRVERGLVENNDVVLVRDMKLFILTDRGMASFTDTPRPIFQTLLTYDLLKKKYIRKQTGLYVIPCPKHEYRVLDGGLLLGLSENRDHFVIWDLDSGFIKHRLRPQFKEKPSTLDHDAFKEGFRKESLLHRQKVKDTVLLTPWERRNETRTAKRRRQEREVEQEVEKMWQLLNEKNNAIDQYLLSDNEKVIVCSYYAHHLCVFSLETMSHLHTLEDRTSMLFLHHAAITHNGSFLVLSNYCDKEKISYVTLWDLHNGLVKKRLKNEPNVFCMALTDDASRIVFGVTLGNILKVWDPFRRKHKIIPGYEKLHLNVDSKLQVIEGGSKAILLSGEVSLWDLDNGTIVSVFTPDTKICCLSLAPDRKTILVGMSDSPSLITLKVASGNKGNTFSTGTNLFGEESTSSEDEANDNDQPLSI